MFLLCAGTGNFTCFVEEWAISTILDIAEVVSSGTVDVSSSALNSGAARE